MPNEAEWIKTLESMAHPIHHAHHLDPLIHHLKDARVVMLGESSHGTSEFYHYRRLITQRLIAEHDFSFIAVEGDWPDCQNINEFALYGKGVDARGVVERFTRWPAWMWGNTDIVRLAQWLHSYNVDLPQEDRAGFYGLDVYSLYESIEAVLQTLKSFDPDLAEIIKARYACFEPFEKDEMAYASSLFRASEGCWQEAILNLQDILNLRIDRIARSRNQVFDLQQNARIVKNAERYFRAMILHDTNSWNVRDEHMMETLEQLLSHHGPRSKAIVWAHNTHIGDYRATDMAASGYLNIGGLARDRFGRDHVRLVGFSTEFGTVVASHSWGGPSKVMNIPHARPGSLESILHEVSIRRSAPVFSLMFDEAGRDAVFEDPVGHRAMGVVYDPDHESRSSYVPTRFSERYDAFVFCDRTSALKPLQVPPERGQIPETFPTGL